MRDLVIVDATSVRTAGSRPDQIHYSATAADVCDVIIGGRRVVRDRAHRLGDVGAQASRLDGRLEVIDMGFTDRSGSLSRHVLVATTHGEPESFFSGL